MKEFKDSKGRRYWEPQDPNDIGLLAIAERATFGETIFPSGWKSPPGQQIALGGVLYEISDDELIDDMHDKLTQ